MKAVWKVLIGAAALAAVTPYEVKRDEETGEVKIKAATWAGTYTKNGDGKSLSLKRLPGLIREPHGEDAGACCDGEACCCGEAEDEDGFTIEVDGTGDEPEAEDGPKPDEA